MAKTTKRGRLSRLMGVTAAVTVAVLVGSSAGSAGAAPPEPVEAHTITWAECANAALRSLGAQCGFLTVPLDYAHPRGATVDLAVSRIRHRAPDAAYQGVLLGNPGGPGGVGLFMAALAKFVPNGGADAYDVVGFDPRGVGSSRPALSCQPDYNAGPKPNYIPATPALERTWLDRSRAYATACGVAGGELLAHMTTVDTARDVDRIRAALGEPRISFYGFSYGTYVGQVYATLFPQRVYRMVLDSSIDPRRVWHQANLDQDRAFDRNINIWFDWVARYDDVYHLGGTRTAVQRAFYGQLAALDANPAGGLVGPDEYTDIFLSAAYGQFSWPDLAGVLAAWVNGHDATGLLSWYDLVVAPGHDNGHAVYAAVECTDAQWPDWPRYRADNWAAYRTTPFITWGNAWFNAPCLYWPAPAHAPTNVDGRRVAPILLIDETLDAATPFEGSLEVRRRFPRASLIAEPGGTNHASTLSGNACVDNQIAAYLAAGTLPPRQRGDGPDALCDPLPVPAPTPPGAALTASPGDRLRPALVR